MARRRDEEEEEDEEGPPEWKLWVRDVGVAVVALVVILVSVFLYTGVWPPLVVVESASMQHGYETSHIGTIDTGDLVFVQAAPTRSDVITYLQGRASGYQTYGDYGDVIIFRIWNQPQETPVIHRAIMYIYANETTGGEYVDVPDLRLLPTNQWQGVDGPTSAPTNAWYDLRAVTITGMGYNHDLTINFEFGYFKFELARAPDHAGYVTMGDNNAYSACAPASLCTAGYDTGWLPFQEDIIGHARGEIPWFGLIKLVLSPAPGGCCPLGWGDPHAPANSWTDLDLALAGLVALPFVLEAVVWAWGKYAWPKVRPVLARAWAKRPGARKAEPTEDNPDRPEDERP